MKRAFVFCLWSGIFLHAAPENASVTAPRLGYVFSRDSNVLRAVDGIPGASLLGPTIDPGFPIADALISPDQNYALVIRADNFVAIVLVLQGGVSVTREITGLTQPADSIILSPGGRSAAIYNRARGVIQLISNLPDAPVAGRELQAGNVGHIAVSDDAKRVLVSASYDSSAITMLGDDLASNSIAVLGPASALAFRQQSHDALIATGTGITLIRESDSGYAYQVFSDRAGASALAAFSRSGDQFFAAYEDGIIQRHDLTGTGQTISIDCHCVPKLLQPMSLDSLFQLTEGGKEPIILLDGGHNRVLFVVREGQ